MSVDTILEPVMLARHSQIFQCGVISVKYEEAISWLVTYKRTQGFKIGVFPVNFSLSVNRRDSNSEHRYSLCSGQSTLLSQFNFLVIWLRFFNRSAAFNCSTMANPVAVWRKTRERRWNWLITQYVAWRDCWLFFSLLEHWEKPA